MSRRAASAVDAFPLAVSGFRLEVAWHLLAVAGLRVGEALALRWADVDATAGLIYVRHAVFGVPYAALAVPRSIAGARVVEAGPVLDVLSRHHRRQEAGRSEWGADYRDEGLVVCRADGRPLHPRDLHRAFELVVADAGLPAMRQSDLRGGRRSGDSLAAIRS